MSDARPDCEPQLITAARAFAEHVEPGDRNAEIVGFAYRADLLLVHAKGDFAPHLADPMASITLCGQDIDRTLNDEQRGRISVLCPACEKVGQQIAAAREAEAAKDKALITEPRVHRFDNTEEAYNATQWNDAIHDGDVLVIAPAKVVGFLNKAWPVALTEEHGELHGLIKPAAEFEDGRYAASVRVAAEQARELGTDLLPQHAPQDTPTADHIAEMRKVANEAHARVRTNPDPNDPEWNAALDRLTVALSFLTKHDPAYADAVNKAAAQLADDLEGQKATPARTKGSAPKHFPHPDAVAARAVLAGMKSAELTDEHDITEPTEAERSVRGFVVEPRGHGLVAAYWVEAGKARLRNDDWHGPALTALFDRFADAGWAVEPLRASSLCVFAHRPQPTVHEAPNHWALALNPPA